MKILFQTRTDIFKRRGGDTVQIEKTAEELRKLGVMVDIKSDFDLDLSSYDLVHIFQLDWISEPYLQAMNAKKQNKPLVLSPIHHSEEEVRKFEKYDRYDFRRLVNLIFVTQESKDIMKNIYRAFVEMNFKKMIPTLSSIFSGFRKQQRDVLKMCDMVLVQTEQEAIDLRNDFKTDFKWKKIVNGVGDVFLKETSEKWTELENYIVTIGRIEARKNQLRIIEAVKRLRDETREDIKLVVIGLFNSRNLEYNFWFQKLLKKYNWIIYVQKVEYEKMPAVYKQAKVCVSASWFETSGLTLLEAVYSGCNVVAPSGPTGARVKEYLRDIPFYCDPVDVNSIKEAIKRSYEAKRPEIGQEMKNLFTWSSVAKETLRVYNELLEGK